MYWTRAAATSLPGFPSAWKSRELGYLDGGKRVMSPAQQRTELRALRVHKGPDTHKIAVKYLARLF
jgi:hypothetical protein